MHDWLGGELNLSDFTITPASEDASFRRYFRVSWNGESAIIMDAPPDRENVDPFIDVTARLLECDVNVPRIRAVNLEAGLLLLDDLGTELYLDVLTDENAGRLYADAMDALHRIQNRGRTAGLPDFDEDLLMREMALFRDWLAARHLRIEITSSIERILEDTFMLLIRSAREQPQVFVHRDYHSRNLLVGRNNNPGIVDYQDAVCGPVTYDLVSLLKDCYVKWPRAETDNWLSAFQERCGYISGQTFSHEQFIRWFDLMGVQRHLKASGIFARLLHRDGKPGFIKDIPRTLSYIVDLELDYSELSPLIDIIRDQVMPALEAGSQ